LGDFFSQTHLVTLVTAFLLLIGSDVTATTTHYEIGSKTEMSIMLFV
jgi:hypothetical protein